MGTSCRGLLIGRACGLVVTVSIPQALEFAIQHYQAGRLRDAEIIFRRVLQLQPRQAEALRWLGLIAQKVGRLPEALGLIEQALSLSPQSVEYLNDQGNILLALGRPGEAVAAYSMALELQPGHHVLLNGLGNALLEAGQFHEALAAYRAALAAEPQFAEGHHNAATALHGLGEYSAALEGYELALRLKPDYAGAHRNMANTLRVLGRAEEALAALEKARHFEPANAFTENSLGVVLLELSRIDESIAAFQRAVALDPRHLTARANLASVRAENGELEAGLEDWRVLLAEHPEAAVMHSNYLYLLSFDPRSDAAAIRREAQRWNDRHATRWQAIHPPYVNSPEPARRLRVGYVSAEFCDHVVGRNLLPLFREHDHQGFEIFCYSGALRPDEITDLIRRQADHWRSTASLSDADLAGQILTDRIDVLVDTTLHMQGGRLLAFARRPAPVQMTFAGYPGTTGLAAMDYRITDPFLDPPGETDADYAETSLRLPNSFWCYDPLEREIAVGPLPATSRGMVTFGCFNHSRKINAGVVTLWARVLAAVPNSRLCLQVNSAHHRDRILQQLEAGGVEAARVEFVATCARPEYLALYQRVDIALDTFPYHGHTTSLDALWMGVPVITRRGATVVSRAGVSQLMNLGLRELIATTEAEFVVIARSLAEDRSRLAELRASLRARMEASPLMDAPRFARNIEAAYRLAWNRWCAGRSASSSR